MTLAGDGEGVPYMMTELRIPAMITQRDEQQVCADAYCQHSAAAAGCFMDMAPLITIMTPILLPVVTNPAIGMDPVHFGVVMIFNPPCTPPVGSALFVGCAIGKTPIERTSKNMRRFTP